MVRSHRELFAEVLCNLQKIVKVFFFFGGRFDRGVTGFFFLSFFFLFRELGEGEGEG